MLRKYLLLSLIQLLLIVPPSVNGITVDEFKEKASVSLIENKDADIIFYTELFKTTDYLQTCRDIYQQILEGNQDHVADYQGLLCEYAKDWWTLDIPIQYSQSKCNSIMSEWKDHNEITSKLSVEFSQKWLLEREENEAYLQETGRIRPNDKTDKWLESTDYHELEELKKNLAREYREFCPSESLINDCANSWNEEQELSILENPSNENKIREKTLLEFRDWFCDYDSKFEQWIYKQNLVGIFPEIDNLQPEPIVDPEPTVSETLSEPKCGSGTILIEGICVVDKSQATESKSRGGGCLIATATFDSELAPQVQKLREIRDSKLLSTESGSQFMEHFNSFYYSFSPIIADYERENPVFKELVKIAITPMLSTLSLMDYADTESEVLGIGISLIILNAMMYVGLPVFGIMRWSKY